MRSLPASSASVTKALHSTLRQVARIETQAAIGEAKRESPNTKQAQTCLTNGYAAAPHAMPAKQNIRSFKKGRRPTHRQEAAAGPHAIAR